MLTDVEVSPDGRTAATIGPQGDVTLWDTETWQPYGKALFDDRSNGFLRFSPDSSQLTVRMNIGLVSEVDVRPTAWVAAACAAANREHTVEEWARVRPCEPYRPACERASRDR